MRTAGLVLASKQFCAREREGCALSTWCFAATLQRKLEKLHSSSKLWPQGDPDRKLTKKQFLKGLDHEKDVSKRLTKLKILHRPN
jgi:hypothetical protein